MGNSYNKQIIGTFKLADQSDGLVMIMNFHPYFVMNSV